MDLSELPVNGGVRQRGEQVTRLETFVDAAFAFAVTLLVVSFDAMPSSFAELYDALRRLPAFLAAPMRSRKFQALSRFPNVQRDTAFVVDSEVSAQEVMTTINEVGSHYMEESVLFDLYCGKGIPEGKKSMAVRVRYRSNEKTLTDDEVNGSHQKIVEALCQRLGAVVR